jgi:glycosyltransferase involved in cell wall biosynthesis
MVFTGTMDYRPNVDATRWFVREVFPRVRRRVPGAEFYVVGANPSPAVRALAEVTGVTVTGAVEDVRPFVAGSRVYVVPLRVGGGTRLKVLEAMASGIPMVSTGLGCEGLEVQPDTHYLRADEPESFAEAVAQILLGERDASAMVKSARRLAEERYDWQVLCPALATVLPSAVR